MNEPQAKLYLASEAFAEYMVDLVADVSVAREYDLPLGSAQAFPAQMLRLSRPASVGDVIFQLELPVLEGLTPAELIAIRQTHVEYFENFRNALRRAARERLKLESNRSSMQIADEIRTDIVEPELAKIRTTLASAEQLIAKKNGGKHFPRSSRHDMRHSLWPPAGRGSVRRCGSYSERGRSRSCQAFGRSERVEPERHVFSLEGCWPLTRVLALVATAAKTGKATLIS
jgi:hypothetical protein